MVTQQLYPNAATIDVISNLETMRSLMLYIAPLPMSLPSSTFLGILTRALRRARHFALVEAVPYQPEARSIAFRASYGSRHRLVILPKPFGGWHDQSLLRSREPTLSCNQLHP